MSKPAEPQSAQLPHLKQVRSLHTVWQEDERLLKLYESGLPSWAIYMVRYHQLVTARTWLSHGQLSDHGLTTHLPQPRYGLPYRPWMRWLTWALFVAVATSSLIMGFWDLYKHMPYLEQASPTAAYRMQHAH